jgi:hypothetical protein
VRPSAYLKRWPPKMLGVGLHLPVPGICARRSESRAQPHAPVALVDLGRRGRLHEVDEHLDEAPRLVAVREVPGVREDLEAAAGNGLVGRPSVCDRDHRVVLAPDDHRGDRGRQVKAVGGPDALAAWVDDGA